MRWPGRLTWCLLTLFAAHRLAAAEPEAASPPASPELKLLLKRLNDQHGQLDDLNLKLSTISTLLVAPGKQPGVQALSRRGEPRFRPLYTINRDGTDLLELLAAPGMITTGTPSVSHDEKMIVVDATAETDAVVQSRIWVYAAAGAFKGMIRCLGCGNTPSWSPDDSQIAYMVNPGNPDGVAGGAWIMNADGTDRRRLGEGWYTRWSPDGKEICVYAHFTQPPSLQIYNIETGNHRNVLGAGDEEDIEVVFGGANWTDDGKRLVTLVRRENEQQLITIDADGDQDSIQVIYREPRTDRTLVGPPVMSPDGKEIVFSVQESDLPDTNTRLWLNTWLHIVDSDGKSPPRLLEGRKIGKINRSMEWTRDSRRIVFSSERSAE